MDTKINLALVGFGKFGKKYYQNIKIDKRFDLKVIFKKSAKNLNKISRKFSIQEIKKNNIQAAIICTPVGTHYKLAKIFITKKIPIILEKPASTSYNNIYKLLKLSKKKNSSVIVNHSDFHNQCFEAILSKKKLIGKINSIEGFFGNYNKDYKNHKDLLKDWIPHPLSLIISLIGNINKVEINNKSSSFKKKSIKMPELFKIKLIFNKKIKSEITIWNTKKRKKRQLIVYGQNGLINYDGCNPNKNFIKFKNTIINFQSKITPMQNILTKFYKTINAKKFASDLPLALQIENINSKIKF